MPGPNKEFLKTHRQITFYISNEKYDEYMKQLDLIGVQKYANDLERYIDEVIDPNGIGSSTERHIRKNLK